MGGSLFLCSGIRRTVTTYSPHHLALLRQENIYDTISSSPYHHPPLTPPSPETIVNNESSDILRILISAFDAHLPPSNQESLKGRSALLPPHLRAEITTLNNWVYETINNGVYKTGFSPSQLDYEANIAKLFAALDRLEAHLGQPEHQPYLFGEFITEADIRLYTTLVRFDVVYYTLFKCNVKMVRMDYPRLHAWLRRLYWSEGEETKGGVFRKTTLFDAVSRA